MGLNGEIIPVRVCRYRQGEDEYMIIFGGCRAVELRAMKSFDDDDRKARYVHLHDKHHLIIYSVEGGEPERRVDPSSSAFWDVAQAYLEKGILGDDPRFESIPLDGSQSIEDFFE